MYEKPRHFDGAFFALALPYCSRVGSRGKAS